ncbi:coiled-coil and C2 domain-containing protein 2A [Mytilus galloprovincialis]|uniref:Coiled-coil and C2 domain-containing protein 2A n=1 Tax=Mytilus galloprovincialis TaxID=29158 RepID=A0A8B6F2W1_MYTGA|nr:coiled-coil and C2 domain-containing protein 2A [Mytilus galloprovincialis]
MDKRKKKDRLLVPGDDEQDGISNPVMDEEGTGPSGGESSAETEAMEADALVKDLKTKHRRKQKELSKVISPKDDLATEMKTIKKKSREKIEEAERQEEEEATMEVADDGTVPMPPDTLDGQGTETVVTFREPEEEAEPEEVEEDPVKRLKKKKIEEEVQAFPTEEAPEEPPAEEPEPEPPAPPEETKTPRGRSLKDKLKSRLAKAKEEAEEEQQQQEEIERKERRLKRQKDQKDRFQEMDETEIRKFEEKREKMKERWKKKLIPEREKRKAELKEKGVFMPSNEEAFDFFARDFEPEPETVKEKAEEESKEKEEKKKKKEKKEGEEEEEEGEDKKEEEDEETAAKKKDDLPEDEQPLLDDIDEEGVGMVAIRRADYDDTPETEKKREEMLFIPSVFSTPTEQKVGEQQQPRFLEDEGFYVGTRPDLGGWNLNIMENRLLKHGDKEWFGEDGRMLALPNPLRPKPSRPQVPEEPEPFLETVYRKAVVREYDNRYIDGSMDNAGFYQLDVDMNSISFSHHHLFSREHVLAERLTTLYGQYCARKNKNMTEFLTEKLKALKSSALHLREHMVVHKSEHSYSDRSNYERRLQDYKYEIRKTRALRDKEEYSDRQLLKNIIHTWKDLKAQRDTQNFNNTPARLQIHKEEVDKIHDQAQWKLEIEEELEEMKEEHEEEYEHKRASYEQQMKELKKQRDAKEEARKRQRRKGSKGSQKSQKSKLSAEQEQDLADDDKKILEEEDLPEPDPPVEFDTEAVKSKIKEKVMTSRRRPGEPKLYPELTQTSSITPTNQCPRGEQQRREDISKCKIYIKVMFNNKEVSRTPSKILSQDFKVNFGQIYNLKIVQWPESIKFQIHETLGFGSEMLAELCVGIPEVSVTSQSVQLENMEFSSDHRVHHSHEGVGSGLPFTFNKTGEMMTLMTTGEISTSVAWAVDENGIPLVPPVTGTALNVVDAMKKMDPMAAIGATGVVDIQKLSKWFEESRLDPNDPANADLVYMLKPKGGEIQLHPPDYFRLEQLQEEFNFCDDTDIANNKRFQLLELRDGEVAEFKNYKLVPAVEKEIPRDTFTEYEKKKREEEKIKQTEDIEEQRAAISRFLQKTREQVMRKFRQLAHKKHLGDVVLEEEVPNIAMIGANLVKVTERRRPLRPERKERKKVTAQAIKDNDLKILVSITRALYVPTRASSSSGDEKHGGMTSREETKTHKTIIGETRVQPFVEVMFQHNTVRTSTGDGPNPSYNEELTLPFRAPNGDYSPSSLQTIDDNVYLNLFDEVLVDIDKDDRQSQTVHQRIERKWLGRMCVPFSTIYYNGKIEGTFQIKAPPILLGYSGEDAEEDGISTSKDGKTYMSLFITMEPPVSPPEPMREKFVTNESEKLLQFAETWQNELNGRFPKREFKSTVVDVNGKSVFVTRYFKSLKPPEELIRENNLETAKLLARYVSLIPHVSDAVVFPGLCDIWSTCDQFLRMNVGDEEEHAVLLTNFFLGIGLKAWIIIGTGIPEGPTAYVLTEDGTNGFLIWNANTGEHYKVHDNYCPLISIGCIINDENIFANVQQYEKPAQMNFEFSNTSYWTPFYGRRFPNQHLGSIQPESLYYFTAKKNVVELQEKLEQHLKNKIMEWRSRYITRWNRHCTQIMRKVLPILEENLGKSPGASHLQDLENQFSSYKVSGFPLNMPFTEISSITEEVFSTGVHAQESSDVEFALAVYMHPYPNNVLSVWVYVASLIRMR